VCRSRVVFGRDLLIRANLSPTRLKLLEYFYLLDKPRASFAGFRRFAGLKLNAAEIQAELSAALQNLCDWMSARGLRQTSDVI
jgi:hypothetical protein